MFDWKYQCVIIIILIFLADLQLQTMSPSPINVGVDLSGWNYVTFAVMSAVDVKIALTRSQTSILYQDQKYEIIISNLVSSIR